MAEVRRFVDSGLGHSSFAIDLGDVASGIGDPPRTPTEVTVVDGGPDTGTVATGRLQGSAQ